MKIDFGFQSINQSHNRDTNLFFFFHIYIYLEFYTIYTSVGYNNHKGWLVYKGLIGMLEEPFSEDTSAWITNLSVKHYTRIPYE